MKLDLLNILCCPTCQRDLELQVGIEEENEIKEGKLICRTCHKFYPITHFIPRFVSSEEYAENFGFEWAKHRLTQLDDQYSNQSYMAFQKKTGFGPEDIKDKWVLDVGCGMGRFMDVVEKMGGTVVGIDLSRAVDVARENLGDRSSTHFVQADVFKLPFKISTFDVIYSIGVLHHTPDCALAFQQVPPLLQSQGQIAVWVYTQGNLPDKFSDQWRKVTARLPNRFLYLLCYVAVFFYYLYKIPLLGYIMRRILPVSEHPDWRWRILDTFDWYSPKYQSKHTYPEVFGWFQNAGLINIDLLDTPVSVRGQKP